MRARTLLLLTLVGVLALTGVAGAQTPNEDTYNRSQVLGEVGEVADAPSQGAENNAAPESGTAPVAEETESAPVTAATPVREGDLPFTGLEVGGIAAGGLLLLGCGVLRRRRVAGELA